jgi:hypothetical protein
MKLPFRRSKPLPERLLQAAARAAGLARLAIKRRTLRPRPVEASSGKRMMRRAPSP